MTCWGSNTPSSRAAWPGSPTPSWRRRCPKGGGLGHPGRRQRPRDYVREQIRIAKSLTPAPFGVNIMLMSPFVSEVAQVVAQEKVAVVTTGAGNPTKFMAQWKEAGIKVIPVVASVAMAKLMTRLGASAVIAEGGGERRPCGRV